MPATRIRTFRLSYDLSDALEMRAQELGYATATDLLKALARYDCLCRSTQLYPLTSFSVK